MSNTPRFVMAEAASIHPIYKGAQFQMGEHFFAGDGSYLFSEKQGVVGGNREYKVGAEAPAEPAAPAFDIEAERAKIREEERARIAAEMKAEMAAPKAAEKQTPATTKTATKQNGGEKSKPLMSEGIDLAAWARDELLPKPAWFKVKKAVEALGMGIDTSNKEGVLAGLVSLGHITQAEVDNA